MWYIVEWKGDKYVYSTESASWYGHYGKRSDTYPGDNYMVPLRNWGDLFVAAREQGHNIAVKKSNVDNEDIFEDTDKPAKTKKSKSNAISIFGDDTVTNDKPKSKNAATKKSNSINIFGK